MTRAEIEKAENLISTEVIYNQAKDICDKIGFDPEKAYPPTDTSEVMLSDIRQSMYVGSMVNLFRRSLYLGATEEELHHIAMHMMVLIHSKKFSLNYKQSEIDNGIQQLSNKYDMNAFLSMPFPVIERRSQTYANS